MNRCKVYDGECNVWLLLLVVYYLPPFILSLLNPMYDILLVVG